MKALVETTSNIMLIDPLTGDIVEWNRPSVITWSSFMDGRVGARKAKVLCAKLKEETTDQDFIDHLKASDGKLELAVASFISSFADDALPPGEVVDAAPVDQPVGK